MATPLAAAAAAAAAAYDVAAAVVPDAVFQSSAATSRCRSAMIRAVPKFEIHRHAKFRYSRKIIFELDGNLIRQMLGALVQNGCWRRRQRPTHSITADRSAWKATLRFWVNSAMLLLWRGKPTLV